MMRTPPRPRGHKSRIARVETLEGRDLLAQVLPSPGGQPPVQVAPPQPSPPVGTVGSPEVAYAQFEPLTGRILVNFTADPAGYDPAVLTNPANYSFSLVQSFEKQPSQSHSRPKAGIVLPPPYVVTGVTLTTPIQPGVAPSVIVSINNNEPLRFGIYRFTIQSSGLVDLAGRPLQGHYSGTFPSGDGQAGDFVTLLAEVNSTVLPALPTLPQPGTVNPKAVVPAYAFYP